MSELIPVIEALIDECQAGRGCALCAVVRTKGSTPQTPGAAMLLRQDCSTLGTLGGGCVEEEVKRRAFGSIAGRTPMLLDFVLDHDYGWDDGLICGGKMSVAVVPVTPGADLGPYRSAVGEARLCRPAAVPLTVEHDGRPVLFKLHLEQRPRLLIAGAGHVGQAVARLAGDLGFQVVVFDDRAEYASPQRFASEVQCVVGDIAAELRRYPIDPSCYVVIVTRGHAHDHQALDAVIRSPAGYIGLIGSRRKARMIFSDLSNAGVEQNLLDRVHTPIGLPIGAITVNEIAISIAAELVQHRRKSAPQLVEGPIEL